MQKGNIKLIILTIALLGLVGGGYFYYQTSQNQAPTTVPDTDSTDDKGKTRNSKVGENGVDVVDGEDIMSKVVNDDNSLTGQLEDVTGGNSSGTAYLLRKNGTLDHYVEAKLPTPEAGLVYEGWLVSKTPSLKFFSTGVMNQSNGIYTLSYTANNEYPGYNEVVITLETKVDATPEKHIIEGVVKK